MVPSAKTPAPNRRTQLVEFVSQQYNLRAVGRFSVSALFSQWLLVALGPVGLSGLCGVFVPGFQRADLLPGN